MIVTTSEASSLFEEVFIEGVYREWKTNKKSGKDTTGKYFEIFNNELIKKIGLPIVKESKKILSTDYNADSVIGCDLDNISVIEEYKGHYLDICTFKRALIDLADVFNKCNEQGKKPPYFVITSPTTNKKFDKFLKSKLILFDPSIKSLMEEHIRYYPLCRHGRITKNYFTGGNPFKLDMELLQARLDFLYMNKHEIELQAINRLK